MAGDRHNSAVLALENGTVLWGTAIGIQGKVTAEVVFNTAMTGYQEILTDPSYAQQIVTFTYPHIGNTGTNDEDVESHRVHAAGLVVRDVAIQHSSWRSSSDLYGYLKANRVVAIGDVDTRHLTNILRTEGALTGCISCGHNANIEDALQCAQSTDGLEGMDVARMVSTQHIYSWQQDGRSLKNGYAQESNDSFKVIVYDFGVKYSILRILTALGCDVTVVPATTDVKTLLLQNPDGILFSNGPGDPVACDYAIKAAAEIIKAHIPLFGICLGHQILALACGAKTRKMKFGHHGVNHPVKNLFTGQVLITSQNHNFTVTEENFPANLRITHRSLFDYTIQGIEHTDVPAFSFQGHPEGSPGPHELRPLFEHFIDLMKLSRRSVDATSR